MTYFYRILRFLIPYRRKVLLTILLNIGTVVFSIVSIGALIPVLSVIFDATEPQMHAVKYDGLSSLKDYLFGNMNYWLTMQLEEHGKKTVLFKVLLFTGILFLCKNVFRYLANVSLVTIQNQVEFDIRSRLHHKVIDLDLSYYAKQKKGDILTRLTSDIHEIQWGVLAVIYKMIQDPLMIIGTLIALFMLSSKLTFFVLLLFPPAAFIISYIGKQLKKPSQRAKEELGQIVSMLEEHLSGILVIKSFQAEDQMKHSFDQANTRYRKNMNHMMFLKHLSSPLSEILGFIVIAAIVWYGGYLILDEQSLSVSVFITYILLFYQIINPAKSLSQTMYDINRAEPSSRRVMELIEKENQIHEPESAAILDEFQVDIEFDQVSFKYEEEWVIQDFSLRIPKGKTVALVGQSGGGKTTLLSLLHRFYDVQKGQIRIDGVPIPNLSKQSVRNQLGYISQESVLFHDTIRNNLLLAAPKATEEELHQALVIANAIEFVTHLPQGIDTIVGDRGATLSGGQRQRIAIARAVLRNPPILLLDEATSALDSESERMVQQAFDQLLHGRTAIVIAHRLSTIMNADHIVVMKHGRIIEQGNHQELLALEGEYHKFVELQNI